MNPERRHEELSRNVATRYLKHLVLALALLTVPDAARGQEESQELRELRQRVADLETALSSLRAEYDGRLATLEKRLSTLEGGAGESASTTPSNATESPAAPEPPNAREESLSEEERASLEEELAGILGGSSSSGQAGGAAAPAPEPTGQPTFSGQARTLNRLNPEISVTGDTSLTLSDHSGDPETNQFQIPEFELAFQSPLDPFSLAKAFVVEEEGHFGVEEAYIDWTNLPGGLGFKFGAFRNDFGKLNRWHQHALPQSNRALVSRAFFGEDGLSGIGASLSWLPRPYFGDYNELWLQVTNDQNDVSFSGRGFDTPVVTFHETNYWDLTNATYFEVGLSASTGVNDPLGQYRSVVVGTDWNLVWSPPAQALYKGLELRGELLWQKREGPEGTRDSLGTYTFATYKLNRRWFLGLRGDWTELPLEPGSSVWGVTPYFDWWQSEFVRIRGQYSYSSRMFDSPEKDNQVFFQVTWSMGPHKHEQY
jgi:hypothetical protein